MTVTNPAGDPRGNTEDEGKGCGRLLLGCLVLPLAVLLVLVLVLTVVSRVRSGHVVFFPEMRPNVAWSTEGTPGEVVGGWSTDDVMVYVSEGGLAGLAPESGDELWRLEPEGAVCGMAGDTADGTGVVLLEGDIEASTGPGISEERLDHLTKDGPAYSCDVALAVDLGSGEELWRTGALADGGSAETALLFSHGSGAEPVGDQVLVRVGGELVGLDQGSGTRLWRDAAFAEGEDDCPVADFLARDDTEVVVAADCGIDEPVHVHVIDPATGAGVSAFEFPRGQSQPNMDHVGRTRLVAADPIHIRVDLGHTHGAGGGYEPDTDPPRRNSTPTLGFDDDGDVLHEIGVHDLFPSSGSQKKLFTVEGDRLYSATDGNGCSNDLQAHDLGTGELLWETGISDPALNLIGVRDGRLLVMLDGDGSFGECSMFSRDWEWQFYTVSTETGEAEPLSPPVTNLRQPEGTDLWWHGDRMFHLERSYGDGPGRMVAYG